jgi:hypothetical protein
MNNGLSRAVIEISNDRPGSGFTLTYEWEVIAGADSRLFSTGVSAVVGAGVVCVQAVKAMHSDRSGYSFIINLANKTTVN